MLLKTMEQKQDAACSLLSTKATISLLPYVRMYIYIASNSKLTITNYKLTIASNSNWRYQTQHFSVLSTDNRRNVDTSHRSEQLYYACVDFSFPTASSLSTFKAVLFYIFCVLSVFSVHVFTFFVHLSIARWTRIGGLLLSKFCAQSTVVELTSCKLATSCRLLTSRRHVDARRVVNSRSPSWHLVSHLSDDTIIRSMNEMLRKIIIIGWLEFRFKGAGEHLDLLLRVQIWGCWGTFRFTFTSSDLRVLGNI